MAGEGDSLYSILFSSRGLKVGLLQTGSTGAAQEHGPRQRASGAVHTVYALNDALKGWPCCTEVIWK